MTPEVYEYDDGFIHTCRKTIGTIGALVKYNNSDMNNFEFRQLARTYIECSTDQYDIAMVMAQAEKRGVDLT
jgi:hypothetical protein